MDLSHFRNKTYPDFSLPDTKAMMNGGLRLLEENYLGKEWPEIFVGKELKFGTNQYRTRDPNDPNVVIGTFHQHYESGMDGNELAFVTGPHLRDELEKVRNASLEWNRLGIEKRAETIERVADIMEDRIWLICAALVREVGKSFIEAYAATAEGIDFLRWDSKLARREYEYVMPKTPEFAGSRNERVLVPHGVMLSIDPFNFQEAIGTDQMAKMLLMGNAVVSSPSDKSSLTGRLIYQAFSDGLEQSGVHIPGLINFVPGGAGMKRALLRQSQISAISFTGSRNTLDSIIDEFGSIKRSNGGRLLIATAETSGVNPVYVHRDANLDEAARGIAAAMCGLSGQKCSAISTLIVHKDVYSKLMPKVYDAIDALKFGKTVDGAYYGGVITREAMDKIYGQIKQLEFLGAKKKYQHEIDNTLPGNNVTATVLEINLGAVDSTKMRNLEIFGPVFTTIQVNNEHEAKRVFNAGDFALTGSIYTEDQALIQTAVDSWNVGQLYVNRKPTGALVGTEAFGGLLSGSSLSGHKAGSVDSLKPFYSEKTISGFNSLR